MADEQQLQNVEKAEVTLPPPGGGVRITLLGSSFPQDDVRTYEVPQQYGIYYEMYRQHPYVRASVDKVANYAVKAGFTFIPEDSKNRINDAAVARLKKFFRRSSPKQLFRITFKDLQIYGESFWLIERNALRAPFRAKRLNPRHMRPVVQGNMLYAWKYGFGPNPDEYPVSRVLHFKIDDPEDDIRGLSPLHSLQRTVAGDLNAMEYNGNFFENSAQTGIVFSLKNTNADEITRNREYLEQNYVGTRNAHRPLVLEGEVEVGSSVAKQGEMEFTAYRMMNRQEILSVLHVDPTKLGINEDANRSTAKEAEDMFTTETIPGLQVVVEEELNEALISNLFGITDTLFKFSETDPRTQLANMKLLAEGQRNGIFSVNKILARLGEPPVEGGDIHWVQTAAGLIPINMVPQVAQRILDKNEVPDRPFTGVGTDEAPVDEDEDE